MTQAQFCLIYRHETTEEPSNNSGFFPLSLFSWFLQELSAGRAQDSVTSQNFALGSPRSAPSTLTRWMGLPVMGTRLTATVACASPTGTSVCSSGGLVSTACSRTCCPSNQLCSCCSSPCASRSTSHTCCQQHSLSFSPALPTWRRQQKYSPCSSHSRKSTSEWLAWAEMKQLGSLPCRSTASTRCLL